MKRTFRRTGTRAKILAGRLERGRAPSLGAAMFSDAAWAEIARSLELSPRELEIARGVFDGLTDRAIGINLRVSEHTIHTHVRHLYGNLRVATREAMVVRVIQEFLFITESEPTQLPPICRYWAKGRCPRQHRKRA